MGGILREKEWKEGHVPSARGRQWPLQHLGKPCPELWMASQRPWPCSSFPSLSPSSFCWEHHPQQTVEVLQQEDTACIIFMELVEDGTS